MSVIASRSLQKCSSVTPYILPSPPNAFDSNILKDLDHNHIVQYCDCHIDRDAGNLYILMEYCRGGDLSSMIKQVQKNNCLIPEETVWHYFMQILLALHYCHHPNASSRSGGSDAEGERKAPILHRDIKLDNGASYVRPLATITECMVA